MQEKIQSIRSEIELYEIDSSEKREQFRLKYLVRKGIIAELFEEFRNIPSEQKAFVGKQLNELRQLAQNKCESFSGDGKEERAGEKLDLTLPGETHPVGARHPLKIIENEITEIFSRIGFAVAEGPEIEDDWHNFTALNFEEDHPARDMQDTFFIQRNPDILLRTHTSNVQVRVMENQKPPIRILGIGRVYRNEAVSARANCFFHQVEGLAVDEGISFSELKGTLFYFVKEMFGEKTEVKFRPSFFPFTEPSAEMDISCLICKGRGCPVCKHTGWVEILGCGMVDTNVLKNVKINPKKYSGYAFGMGIERVAMLKYQINDIRIFFENDVRFLSQFRKF